MNYRRRIIIGLDGVPFDLIKHLSETGIMPNTKKIISQGIFKKMESSIPEISSVAWSSIITGKNSAEHGIFGFTDLYPNSYKIRFPNFRNLGLPPFWESIEGKSIIINVPSTYPVNEMKGIHISGFVSIDLEKSVHPKSLVSKLKELEYRLDANFEKAHKSMDLFLSDLDKTLDARIKTYRYLWNTEQDWQLFMLVFTEPDRLMHFLWDAYEDENHKYHTWFLKYFSKIDEVIGEIKAKIDEKDILILLSDHGFESLNKDVNLNFLLREKGFLRFKNDQAPILGNINKSTKAFALEPSRIYLNLKNKYPEGNVFEQDRKKVITDLETIFYSLEIEGKRVIKNIHRKEEIYSGPLLDQAPDLVLVANSGFNLRANIKADRLTDQPIFTGKHRQDNAFFLIENSAGENNIPDNLTVYNVKEIVEQRVGWAMSTR